MSVPVSEEHVKYAQDRGVETLNLATWKNQFSEDDRNRVIELGLPSDQFKSLVSIPDPGIRNAKLKDLFTEKARQDMEKQNGNKVNTAEIETNSSSGIQFPPDPDAVRVLRKVILTSLFGFNALPTEDGALARMVRDYFAEKAQEFKDMFFLITKLSANTQKEVLKRAILYALADVLDIKTTPAQNDVVEIYGKVIKFEYAKRLTYAPEFKGTAIETAAERFASVMDSPVSEVRERMEKYFPAALVEIKKELKDLF